MHEQVEDRLDKEQEPSDDEHRSDDEEGYVVAALDTEGRDVGSDRKGRHADYDAKDKR